MEPDIAQGLWRSLNCDNRYGNQAESKKDTVYTCHTPAIDNAG